MVCDELAKWCVVRGSGGVLTMWGIAFLGILGLIAAAGVCCCSLSNECSGPSCAQYKKSPVANENTEDHFLDEYTQVSGTWSMVAGPSGYFLDLVTSSSNAVIIFTDIDIVSDRLSIEVQLVLSSASIGSHLRIIYNYTDVNNYSYVDIERRSSFTYFYRTTNWHVSSGVHTQSEVNHDVPYDPSLTDLTGNSRLVTCPTSLGYTPTYYLDANLTNVKLCITPNIVRVVHTGSSPDAEDVNADYRASQNISFKNISGSISGKVGFGTGTITTGPIGVRPFKTVATIGVPPVTPLACRYIKVADYTRLFSTDTGYDPDNVDCQCCFIQETKCDEGTIPNEIEVEFPLAMPGVAGEGLVAECSDILGNTYVLSLSTNQICSNCKFCFYPHKNYTHSYCFKLPDLDYQDLPGASGTTTIYERYLIALFRNETGTPPVGALPTCKQRYWIDIYLTYQSGHAGEYLHNENYWNKWSTNFITDTCRGEYTATVPGIALYRNYYQCRSLVFPPGICGSPTTSITVRL